MGIKIDQHLRWREQSKKADDISFVSNQSIASSNQSQASLNGVQSAQRPLHQVDSLVETRQSLQSSISIDSGCPLTCGSSLMETSMQSSLMSDSLLDNRINFERMEEFHDSQLDLQQLRSIQMSDLYDQVPLNDRLEVDERANDGDNEEGEEQEEQEEQEEEQLLVVDAYGGVHQFSQSMHSSDSYMQPKQSVIPTAFHNPSHGLQKLSPCHLVRFSVDKVISPAANASATYRISRRADKHSDNSLLLQRRESGYESSAVAPSPVRRAVEPLPYFAAQRFNGFANETNLIDRHHHRMIDSISPTQPPNSNPQVSNIVTRPRLVQQQNLSLKTTSVPPCEPIIDKSLDGKPKSIQQTLADQKQLPSLANEETNADRMHGKRLQIRRVMEILHNSSSFHDHRSSVASPSKRSAGGCSLLYSMRNSRKDILNKKSSVVDEVWVPAATESAAESTMEMLFPLNRARSSMFKAPETEMLQERQRKLQLQLKALVSQCSSLTPTASKSNFVGDFFPISSTSETKPTNSRTDKMLFNDCARSNQVQDAFHFCSPIQANGKGRDDKPGVEENFFNTSPLPLSADSGILNSSGEEHSNSNNTSSDNSASSSPILKDEGEQEEIAGSSYSLADRIECLRNELQTVVKVAIEQIRQSQSLPTASSQSSSQSTLQHG